MKVSLEKLVSFTHHTIAICIYLSAGTVWLGTILSKWARTIDGIVWFWFFVFLLVVCILLVAYVLHLRPKYRYIADYGVYQDTKKGTYNCPICKSPLQVFEKDFYCHICRRRYAFPGEIKPKARGVVSKGIEL